MSTELIVHEVEDIRFQLAPLPTPTPKATVSLTSHDYARHIARLNVVVEATLRHYWVPVADEVIRHFEMEDWTEALQDWPVDQTRRALRRWVKENPRRRPNYGDILQILKRDRGDEWVEQSRRMSAASKQSQIKSVD